MSTNEGTQANTSPSVPDLNDNPPTQPIPRSDPDTTYLLPKWVYIRDRNGRYLSVRSGPTYGTVTFRGGDADITSAFQAVPRGSRYSFQGSNSNYIMRYYNDWYSCDPASMPSFQIITATGNYVYLKDNYGPSRFPSSDLTANGAPIAYDYIKDSSRFEIVQAAIKNEIFDVNYNISGAQVRDATPVIALSTSVRNDSDGDASQTLTYSYSKSKVGTWNNTAGVTLGVSTTFSAGVPFVASAEFEVSVSTSYSHEWGGEEGETETISSSTTVIVPPKKKARATIIIRNAQIDVGFTYKERILWTNGQSEENVKSGIYKNVDSWHVDVQLDNWEDA
ncbi:Aerolisin/ETX pore-forming domain-containing protein [Armillaria solidipes]|uniref:Aerolisin/ETX pore-forming domain-containing protein n=1 Tax=Armillaria solidipes TaxID=1076256 RepID=A0A2H3CLR5_9AGAR|nr:Aerolisin/ETX pore-forming domain-containing protein [Armillaria solidipes]